jgi:hypothetical protein
MTIFSHSVIAGSSSIARTRLRRLFAAFAVAIHVTCLVGQRIGALICDA